MKQRKIRKQRGGKLRSSQKGVGDWQCSCPGSCAGTRHPGWQRVWGTGGLPPTLSTSNPCTTDISQPGLPTLSCVVNEGCPPHDWGMQGRGSLLEELSLCPQQTSLEQTSPVCLKRPPSWAPEDSSSALLLSSSCAGKSLF